MVKIRFQRFGHIGKPFYRIVVADSRRKRDGAYLERIGFYNPTTKICSLNIFSILSWLKKGAKPTPVICGLLLKHYYNVVKLAKNMSVLVFAVNQNGVTSRINSNVILLNSKEIDLLLRKLNPLIVSSLTFRLLLKAYNHLPLEKAVRQINYSLRKRSGFRFFGNYNKPIGCTDIKYVRLPTKLRRYCVLSSPHINKSARDHFELRIHKRLLDFQGPTANFFIELAKIKIPPGIDIKVQSLL